MIRFIEKLISVLARKILFLIISLQIIACHWDKQPIDFRRAEKLQKVNKFSEALTHYEKVIAFKQNELSLKAARKSARLSEFHLKQFWKALGFHRYLVTHSTKEVERISSQERIVNIYFDKLADYKMALVEINRLLEISHTKEKKIEYQLKAAKSYFYLGDFRQAEVDLDVILSKKLSDKHQFEAMSLKGDTLLTAKRLGEAIKVYKSLQGRFPQQAMEEKIGLNIAVCYEEMDELDLAIEELQKIQKTTSDSDLIEVKITRLKVRRKDLPNPKNFRK